VGHAVDGVGFDRRSNPGPNIQGHHLNGHALGNNFEPVGKGMNGWIIELKRNRIELGQFHKVF
jgi:hypothetical protein